MNQTLEQLYDEYRDAMEAALALEELVPHKFMKAKFVKRFERKVERLDTLLNLYWDLLLVRKTGLLSKTYPKLTK